MITSTANQNIKQIRKLRERKERQSSGLFYAEGIRIVAEAAEKGAPIETLVVSPDLLTNPFGQELAGNLLKRGVTLLEVSAEVFKSIALKDGPQGLAAVIRQQWANISAIDPHQGSTWVALDEVADPGNLGTILRTHDAVGGEGLILLDNSTDPYDPTSIRASMGAVFTQRLVKTTFNEFAAWKRGAGMALVGTSGDARQDYQGMVYPKPVIVMMGSEREGLSEEHFRLCDALVRIPMVGSSDSLNLAVATAVTLYEIFNQRRSKEKVEPDLSSVQKD
jgi:RNA methyltransferase, TrmH family